ncbi:hypothetical protein DFP94_103430 [Fontibacillus phaseoli]|uniref:Uncharacterized protein n=1 Tax=Fontibacillus phaseoli TaxID=1416533 RepID=A0A369BJT0_9BACL|nr:hypothetical protein [Fontibacillus phaseoli]RCX20697.1 hypothetical protein DFP94_103430 [Fontibacillus phaseoli]
MQHEEQAGWKAEKGLRTRWGKEMYLLSVLPEYPRPRRARDEWVNLNGGWNHLHISSPPIL